MAGFTRTSRSAVAQPVDISVAGHLLPAGGDIGAVLRRNNVVIGRVKASLSPLPPGSGSWMERLMGAPLSGGIRRSEEHTSELQSLMRISYAGFCLKKKIYYNGHMTLNSIHTQRHNNYVTTTDVIAHQ